jgi:hypothetical protein
MRRKAAIRPAAIACGSSSAVARSASVVFARGGPGMLERFAVPAGLAGLAALLLTGE